MEVEQAKSIDQDSLNQIMARNAGLASSESKYVEMMTRMFSNVPLKYRSVWLKAHEGKSRAAAIKAKCQDCVGWEKAVENVSNCTSYSCPLWTVRPYRKR